MSIKNDYVEYGLNKEYKFFDNGSVFQILNSIMLVRFKKNDKIKSRIIMRYLMSVLFVLITKLSLGANNDLVSFMFSNEVKYVTRSFKIVIIRKNIDTFVFNPNKDFNYKIHSNKDSGMSDYIFMFLSKHECKKVLFNDISNFVSSFKFIHKRHKLYVEKWKYIIVYKKKYSYVCSTNNRQTGFAHNRKLTFVSCDKNEFIWWKNFVSTATLAPDYP